jgi:hypothetical protein
MASSCLFDSGNGCDIDLDSCENDFECPFHEVCDESIAGKTCVPAVECSDDADCSAGEACEQRQGTPPQHPFDAPVAGKRVCACQQIDCSPSTTSASSSSGTGGTMGVGGAGAGGAASAGGSGGFGGGAASTGGTGGTGGAGGGG